jgi:hypothetical protein
LQLLQELADVVADLRWVGGDELFLQLRKNLNESALAVAMLQHLASGALELDCAFGKEDYAILLASTPAASSGQPRLASI